MLDKGQLQTRTVKANLQSLVHPSSVYADNNTMACMLAVPHWPMLAVPHWYFTNTIVPQWLKLALPQWPMLAVPYWPMLVYVTYLHKTSLMSQFLHVQFNIPLCRAQSVLQSGKKQKSVLYLYPKLWNFENSENIKY